MFANPKINRALANRVANFPRLCRRALCLVKYRVNGRTVKRLARYKGVAWIILNGKPTVIGHVVRVGGVQVHIEIGNTLPLHKSCTQCGKEKL
ncbi:hypothetical protein GALMADRAFT_137577 [Galerina marginata CBS 339.88]|uniref:Uncharacterized protein n=1 Tax=Galerina marginata (strain CBS 339.88) TaxID=685588 RepID=A0A067T5R8_GALM3|nr:hypothetical protein GALMADRAFT_137577 [Galerina marginata CBS 339.88]